MAIDASGFNGQAGQQQVNQQPSTHDMGYGKLPGEESDASMDAAMPSQAQGQQGAMHYNVDRISLFQSFGSKGLGLFNSQGDGHSEYLQKIKEIVDERIKANMARENSKGGKNKLPMVDCIVIPTENEFGTIPYATMVLSCNLEDSVYYYFFQFTHTGKPAMTAIELLDTYNKNLQIKMSGGNNQDGMKPYRLYDATIGDRFKTILKKNIINFYGSRLDNANTKFISLQGTNFNPQAGDVKPEKLAECVLDIGYNAIIIELGLTKLGFYRDITVANILPEKQGEYSVNIDVDLVDGSRRFTDKAGNFIRTDFQGSLVLEVKSNNTQELCQLNNIDTVCNFKGYVSALPGKEVVVDPVTRIQSSVTRLHPHIILTECAGKRRTLGFTLLSIAASGVMLERENWLASLKNNVNTPDNCPGKFNAIVNITKETDPKNIGPLDFKGKAWTDASIVQCLSEMFTLSPILSIDFLSYGDQSEVDSTFILASRPDVPQHIKVAACKDIIKAAHDLTLGNFPLDFNVNDIFKMGSVPFPAGFYNDTIGTKDIRHIDLATVLTYARGDEEAIATWLFSELPEYNNNLDPFFAKLKIISSTVGAKEATICGRGIRVTFSPKFVTVLLNALNAAGLNPTYRPFGVSPEAKMSLDGFNMYFGDAGINASFGQKSVFNGYQNQGPLFYGNYMW